MACIKKLSKAVTYDCKGGAVGIAELYLLNYPEVATVTNPTGAEITALTLSSGAKSYPVDCFKNGVKLIEAQKATDVSNALDQSLNITLYAKNEDAQAIVDALLNGRFMAAVKFKDLNAIKQMIGLNCGLEVSAIDTDSSANGGFTAITIKTPDDARGERRVKIGDTAWNTIVNAKIS